MGLIVVDKGVKEISAGMALLVSTFQSYSHKIDPDLAVHFVAMSLNSAEVFLKSGDSGVSLLRFQTEGKLKINADIKYPPTKPSKCLINTANQASLNYLVANVLIPRINLAIGETL